MGKMYRIGKAGQNGSVEIEWNEAAFVDFLIGTETEAELQRRAEAVAQSAKAMAPVRTGRYRDSIRTQIEHGRKRSRVLIVADVPYAMKIESRMGVLRKAMQAHSLGN